jgi:hypothetical protein
MVHIKEQKKSMYIKMVQQQLFQPIVIPNRVLCNNTRVKAQSFNFYVLFSLCSFHSITYEYLPKEEDVSLFSASENPLRHLQLIILHILHSNSHSLIPGLLPRISFFKGFSMLEIMSAHRTRAGDCFLVDIVFAKIALKPG